MSVLVCVPARDVWGEGGLLMICLLTRRVACTFKFNATVLFLFFIFIF